MKKDNKKSRQYQVSPEELRQIQSIQRELIREVDRICKKYGIHYNMVGGTMLGAIRHRGYIPWDDDADIGFLRAEYEKFRDVCRTELDADKYYMQDLRDTEGYRWGYGKLRRRNTEFVRLNQECMPYDQGISIDLMPFDNVPDKWLERKIHFFSCFIYRKLLWSKIGCKVEKNLCVRFIYKIMNCIPVKIIIKRYQRFIDKGQQRKTHLVRILTFPTPRGVYGYDRKWYTQLDRYPFDDMMLPGAKDYDGYLRVKYGEYMKLPSKQKRKVHPISKLKLLEE